MSVLLVALLAGIGINQLTTKANAEDYSPLDFIAGYNKFEVRVGIDKIQGRYYTYHYEFNE
ncbi:hypothetical protein KAU19_04530 [Candidatus Parcubacteria bacterium]|nr:hypothetical protein [Candidatus Parcubacteria bacterium]